MEPVPHTLQQLLEEQNPKWEIKSETVIKTGILLWPEMTDTARDVSLDQH